jgi:hypothetical protein
MKVTTPKFNYNQRVYDGYFGYMIIKGLRFETEPIPTENYQKIIYGHDNGSGGIETPEWEYKCYYVSPNGYLDHQEVGWFKETQLRLNDNY